MRSELAQKIRLDFIRYSQVWEDHLLLRDGLEIDPGDDVLTGGQGTLWRGDQRTAGQRRGGKQHEQT